MEFLLGGLAGCGACLFTNPLDVVKTRMQLQGELRKKGQYVVHYRNVFHAFSQIARVDGVFRGLQSGLVPALWFQLTMNGSRLGIYHLLQSTGMTTDRNGAVSFPRVVVCGAFSGVVAAVCGSPAMLVKTHIQAEASEEIAVGFQRHYTGTWAAFCHIYNNYGFLGLFRGATTSIPRIGIGSCVQLTSFTKSKQALANLEMFSSPDSFSLILVASIISGVAVTIAMTPFDLISTRVYNQDTDASGRGKSYSGVMDAFLKVYKTEGVWGFYKGWAPSFLRIGPHISLTMLLWDISLTKYKSFCDKNK